MNPERAYSNTASSEPKHRESRTAGIPKPDSIKSTSPPEMSSAATPDEAMFFEAHDAANNPIMEDAPPVEVPGIVEQAEQESIAQVRADIGLPEQAKESHAEQRVIPERDTERATYYKIGDGKRRSPNSTAALGEYGQDYGLVDAENGIMVVADGMSSSEGSYVVAEAAAQELQTALQQLNESIADLEPAAVNINSLVRSVQQALDKIAATAGRKAKEQGAQGATTLTGSLMIPALNKAIIIEVGDSPTYRIRGGQAEQLAPPTTWTEKFTGWLDSIQQRLENKESARKRRARANSSALKNGIVVDSSSGEVAGTVFDTRSQKSPNVFVVDMKPGDTLAHLSDGLKNHKLDPAEVLPQVFNGGELDASKIPPSTADDIVVVGTVLKNKA